MLAIRLVFPESLGPRTAMTREVPCLRIEEAPEQVNVAADGRRIFSFTNSTGSSSRLVSSPASSLEIS